MKEVRTVTGVGVEGQAILKGVLLELKQGASFVKRQGKSPGCPGQTGSSKNEPGLSDDRK